MYYVYLLRSIPNPDQTYVGFSENLKARLTAHNNRWHCGGTPVQGIEPRAGGCCG